MAQRAQWCVWHGDPPFPTVHRSGWAHLRHARRGMYEASLCPASSSPCDSNPTPCPAPVLSPRGTHGSHAGCTPGSFARNAACRLHASLGAHRIEWPCPHRPHSRSRYHRLFLRAPPSPTCLITLCIARAWDAGPSLGGLAPGVRDRLRRGYRARSPPTPPPFHAHMLPTRGLGLARRAGWSGRAGREARQARGGDRPPDRGRPQPRGGRRDHLRVFPPLLR